MKITLIGWELRRKDSDGKWHFVDLIHRGTIPQHRAGGLKSARTEKLRPRYNIAN